MAELLINGKDAYKEWGIRMGEGFIDTLNGAASMKEYITNDSRLKDGVEYIGTNPKVNELTHTLHFTLKGKNKADFVAKLDAFQEMLYTTNDITIKIPDNSEKVYHMRYISGAPHGRSMDRTFGKLSVKFIEPNPRNRKETETEEQDETT